MGTYRTLLRVDPSNQSELATSLVRDGASPFILVGGARDWPALSRWTDAYLAEVAGDLEVQVRPASDYRDGGSRREQEAIANVGLAELLRQISSGSKSELCYARETRALDHAPALLADIDTPALLLGSAPHASPRTGNDGAIAWIGPAQTKAQLHWDPEHNLFAQVRGRKLFTLAPPSAARRAYPIAFSVEALAERPFFRMRTPLLDALRSAATTSAVGVQRGRTRRFRRALVATLSEQEFSTLCDFLLDVNNFHVDAEMPDLRRHPLFADVECTQAILEPGDLVFIPRYWLHAVRALEASISINWFFLPSRHGAGVEEPWIREILLGHLLP